MFMVVLYKTSYGNNLWYWRHPNQKSHLFIHMQNEKPPIASMKTHKHVLPSQPQSSLILRAQDVARTPTHSTYRSVPEI